MAGKNERPYSYLKSRLLEKGHAFSFFQAVRLLRLLIRSEGRNAEPQSIRIGPELSLTFPAADLRSIEERVTPDGKPYYGIIAQFLTLYGSASCLPTFYTDDLIDDFLDGYSGARDFVDIVNGRVYQLLFEGRLKYRCLLQVYEEGGDDFMDRLYALIGMGDPALRASVPEAFGLLRYAGLLSMKPRTAAGLEALLSDAFGGITIRVVQGLEQETEIPADQRCVLGQDTFVLGREVYLDTHCRCAGRMLRIDLDDLTLSQYREFLPGGGAHERLLFLIETYLDGAYTFEVGIAMTAQGDMLPPVLGGEQWTRIGMDAWLGVEQAGNCAAVVFSSADDGRP